MHILRALFRIVVTAVAILVGTVVILAVAWIPIEIRGARLSAWPPTICSRFFLWLYGVRVDFPHADRLRRHEGFVFPNHVSPFDILVLSCVVPVRFLAKIEVRRWPLIGWVAVAVGTVFVDRGSKSSREAARRALTTVNTYPPVAVFPEGGIFPPADEINPFRYGAFEIAADGRISFLPLVLVYDPLDIVYWADEPLWSAAWRVAAHGDPITVRVVSLKPVQPDETDTAADLAVQTHSAMTGMLHHVRQQTDVVTDGL